MEEGGAISVGADAGAVAGETAAPPQAGRKTTSINTANRGFRLRVTFLISHQDIRFCSKGIGRSPFQATIMLHRAGICRSLAS
jgi:hypothetical protein